MNYLPEVVATKRLQKWLSSVVTSMDLDDISAAPITHSFYMHP